MEKVRLQVNAGVASVVLDNPRKANCIDLEMAEQLLAVCDVIDADDAIGAAIITGANGSFCSGADRDLLADVARDPADDGRFRGLGLVYESFQRVGRLAVPTIAAVNGSAVGAGVNLMLATDLRIVSDTAIIRPGFQRLGLHPGGGHFVLLGRTVSLDASAALGLFGAEIDGVTAAALGMAWASRPGDQILDEAERMAAAPAADPALARQVVVAMRAELGPPRVSWAVGSELERAAQMWSLKRSVKLAPMPTSTA